MSALAIQNTAYGTYVFKWQMVSSNGITKYIVKLWEKSPGEYHVTCDCAGWRIVKKDKVTGAKLPRSCKHTREILATQTAAQIALELQNQKSEVHITRKIHIMKKD